MARKNTGIAKNIAEGAAAQEDQVAPTTADTV